MKAEISPCGRYRFSLEREIADAGITVAFFGVNPSRADHERDDQTSQKWKYFARQLGARRYIAGNPFALRSHDVRELSRATDPVGWPNDWHLQQIIAAGDILVPCWGSRLKLPVELRPALDSLRSMLFASGKPLRIFGLTKSDDPKHPLMLSYQTQLIDWRKL